MTTKQIINSTGYNLPNNWKDLKFSSKKKVSKAIKDAYNVSKNYDNFKL